MLVREPEKRASLRGIMQDPWLTRDGPPIIPLRPLISREHITTDIHKYVIRRMIEGKISTQEEILK